MCLFESQLLVAIDSFDQIDWKHCWIYSDLQPRERTTMIGQNDSVICTFEWWLYLLLKYFCWVLALTLLVTPVSAETALSTPRTINLLRLSLSSFVSWWCHVYVTMSLSLSISADILLLSCTVALSPMKNHPGRLAPFPQTRGHRQSMLPRIYLAQCTLYHLNITLLVSLFCDFGGSPTAKNKSRKSVLLIVQSAMACNNIQIELCSFQNI